MRVSLFGLSPRRTNLMNLEIVFLQLIILHMIYTAYTCLDKYISFIFTVTAYLFGLNVRSVDIPVYVYLPEHAIWHSFYLLVGLLF